MSSSNKRGFTAGVYLSNPQNSILPHPPIHIVDVYAVYFFTQGRGGELNQREG
jgi:hypothetical protein